MRFLLIHGAWHGGWAFDAVADRLRTHGGYVLAPDLPGLAGDAHNLAPDIGLETHIEAVLPEAPCIVCAHSYAGMIARALVDRTPEHVAGLVLIEALWPRGGQSALDLLAPAAREDMQNTIAMSGDGWRIPVPDVARFALPDPQMAQTVAQRLTPHPARTFGDRLEVASPSPAGTYLISNDRTPQPYAETADRLRADGWTVDAMPGGHELMLTQPDRVAEALLAAAKM